ncbi:hypothetical protein ACFWZA_01755 [[Kitasatospora] papulosa]|uniref:hypothetical protein n=1 Tax=[Kitasatospora] papulosa TaxID=1464011 RepID=UPI0036C7B5C1
MTSIEELLSRALLVRDRTTPRDIVPAHETPRPDHEPTDTPTTAATATEDLRALCEALVTHTPGAAVADFITDQVPEPRSALVLACILQLTGTDDGARFWWQYAAGAGQPAAAYCLYLHHLALGDRTAADWWHDQADDPQLPAYQQPLPRPTAQEDPHDPPTTPTILRMLRHLAKGTARARTAKVTELMAYVPTAVVAGYLRAPDIDLPTPGSDFAGHINTLLTNKAASPHPDRSSDLPARPDPSTKNSRRPGSSHPRGDNRTCQSDERPEKDFPARARKVHRAELRESTHGTAPSSEGEIPPDRAP